MAGTKFRGEFEERMANLIEEIENSNVILFIDEMHMLMGAGNSGGGGGGGGGGDRCVCVLSYLLEKLHLHAFQLAPIMLNNVTLEMHSLYFQRRS